MPRWSNLSKGSANEWKNQIYLDFSRMQPTFTAQSDVKLRKNREQDKINLVYFLCRDGVTYQKVVQMSGKTKFIWIFPECSLPSRRKAT